MPYDIGPKIPITDEEAEAKTIEIIYSSSYSY